MRSAALSFCICFRFCSGKESCRTQKQTSENHISSYLRASYCFLLSFFTFVSFFYKAKPSMKTAHTEITFLLLFTSFSVTRFAMHRIYVNRINSRGMSRVFCDLRSQKTPRGILPVNSNNILSSLMLSKKQALPFFRDSACASYLFTVLYSPVILLLQLLPVPHP